MGRYPPPAVGAPTAATGPVTRVDLHTHSRRSDGVLEPAALVAAAAAAGVRLLALTDHDTLAGVRELLGPGALPLPPGFELVAGIELSTTAGADRELHLLGYGLDPDDEGLEARLASLRAERRRRFERIVDRLRAIGFPIDEALAGFDLAAIDALGRPTIARALVAAGHASSVADAFERFLGRGGPAYVPRPKLDPAAAIGLVREAGGFAVLAHPADVLPDDRLLAALAGAGLAGLEVYYRGYSPEVVATLAATARRHRLLATGGTDFHGDDGPYDLAARGIEVPLVVGRRFRTALGLRAGAAPARRKRAADRATLVGR